MLSFVCFVAACAAADSSYQISAAEGPYFVVDDRVVMDRWLAERFVVQPKRFSGKSLADFPPGEISINFRLDSAELFAFDLR